MLRVRMCERIKVWIQMTMIRLEKSDERTDFIIIFFPEGKMDYITRSMRYEANHLNLF